MAKTIQIREVPEDIHRTLRTRAAAAGVSLSDYLLREVTHVAERPAVADVLARAGDRGIDLEVQSIVDAINSGRTHE